MVFLVVFCHLVLCWFIIFCTRLVVGHLWLKNHIIQEIHVTNKQAEGTNQELDAGLWRVASTNRSTWTFQFTWKEYSPNSNSTLVLLKLRF